jgi:hypothetical protein
MAEGKPLIPLVLGEIRRSGAEVMGARGEIAGDFGAAALAALGDKAVMESGEKGEGDS